VGTKKTKKGRAEKCGRALLPLYTCGSGKKIGVEPANYSAFPYSIYA
jgi:hypothetical protein